MGLLDQAKAMDFRRPQDYFQHIWSTAFRADALAAAVGSEPSDQPEPAEETL